MTGGVVFRVGGELFFLPASIASKVLPMPGVARVPGAPENLVGVALVEGAMVPVVAVGPMDARRPGRSSPSQRRHADNRPLLVCTYLGERFGLVGAAIVATGRFEAPASDHVIFDGASVPLFDVGAVVDPLRDGRWAV